MPVLPVVKILQIVGAHDPDETDAAISLPDFFQRAGGVALAERLLEGRHLDARIMGDFLAECDPF